MGRISKTLERLSSEHQESSELKHDAAKAGCKLIVSQPDRAVVTLHGVLRSVTLRPVDGVTALEAELYDGSASVTLDLARPSQDRGHRRWSPAQGLRPHRHPQRRSRDLQPALRTRGMTQRARDVEQLVRARLATALGGRRGVVESAAPIALFTLCWITTHSLKVLADRERRCGRCPARSYESCSARASSSSSTPCSASASRTVVRGPLGGGPRRVPAGHPDQRRLRHRVHRLDPDRLADRRIHDRQPGRRSDRMARRQAAGEALLAADLDPGDAVRPAGGRAVPAVGDRPRGAAGHGQAGARLAVAARVVRRHGLAARPQPYAGRPRDRPRRRSALG